VRRDTLRIRGMWRDNHIDGQVRGGVGNGGMEVGRKEVAADIGKSSNVIGDEIAGFGGNAMTGLAHGPRLAQMT
jgi:hypothetical protein